MSFNMCVWVCVIGGGGLIVGVHSSTVYPLVVTWADITVGLSAKKTHTSCLGRVAWSGSLTTR